MQQPEGDLSKLLYANNPEAKRERRLLILRFLAQMQRTNLKTINSITEFSDGGPETGWAVEQLQYHAACISHFRHLAYYATGKIAWPKKMTDQEVREICGMMGVEYDL